MNIMYGVKYFSLANLFLKTSSFAVSSTKPKRAEQRFSSYPMRMRNIGLQRHVGKTDYASPKQGKAREKQWIPEVSAVSRFP